MEGRESKEGLGKRHGQPTARKKGIRELIKKKKKREDEIEGLQLAYRCKRSFPRKWSYVS